MFYGKVYETIQKQLLEVFLKRDFNTDVFLSVLQNFWEHLFWKTSMFIITSQLPFFSFFELPISFSLCFDLQELFSFIVDPGNVTAEYYSNIASLDVQSLLDRADFKQQVPTKTGALDNMVSARNLDNKFGYKLAAYFVAPMTGNYIFTVSCDDKCNVYFL